MTPGSPLESLLTLFYFVSIQDVEYAINEESESAGFAESISPCFEPYLSLYIEAEDK